MKNKFWKGFFAGFFAQGTAAGCIAVILWMANLTRPGISFGITMIVLCWATIMGTINGIAKSTSWSR